MSSSHATLERNAMVRLYSPLVRRVAHRLIVKLPPSVEIDDLIQVGLIGLTEALTRFDEALGVQFETFATQRIRGAMLDELRGVDWASRSSRRGQKDIERVIHRLEQSLGRAPAESEVAKGMKLSLAGYQELLAKVRSVQLVYLEDLVASSQEGEDFLDRHVGDSEADPMKVLGNSRKHSALVAAIKVLPKREQHLMSLYYEQDMKLKEIAAVLGVTESRVCQLHGQSIARLRTNLRAH
jgi:RNA polymerase sigma factor FliA